MMIADLCAGIGGFHLAFKRLGVKTAIACEIDNDAVKTYLHNFPDTPIIPDITKMSGKDMRGAKILCAGFPCQAFSIAGYQKGFEDARGTIFFDIARIASEAEPEILFLENVENLMNHESGRTFKTILKDLKELKYHVTYNVLDSRSFGMYQMRSRTIIVGFKKKAQWDRFSLPTGTAKPPKTFHYLLDDFDKVGDRYFIGRDDWLAENFIHMIKNKENPNYIYQFRRQYWREYSDRCPTLTANMGTGGHNVPFIFDNRGEPPVGKLSYRKFTPMEAFRLQGFSTPAFTFSTPEEVADSKLYKQAGNSVPLNLIYEVAKAVVRVTKKRA